MVLVKYFGKQRNQKWYIDYDVRSVHVSDVFSFLQRHISFTMNHFELVCKFINKYAICVNGGRLYMKISNTPLFQKWWDEVPNNLKKRNLKKWLRYPKCNIPRRKRISQETNQLWRKVQYFKRKMKKGKSNKMNGYKYLRVQYANQQASWMN